MEALICFLIRVLCWNPFSVMNYLTQKEATERLANSLPTEKCVRDLFLFVNRERMKI